MCNFPLSYSCLSQKYRIKRLLVYVLEPFTCPEGTTEFTYDENDLEDAAINILRNGTNVKGDVMNSSPGISSDSTITLEIVLTPKGRSTNIYVELEALHATSVTFTTDNTNIATQEVKYTSQFQQVIETIVLTT